MYKPGDRQSLAEHKTKNIYSDADLDDLDDFVQIKKWGKFIEITYILFKKYIQKYIILATLYDLKK